MLTDKTSLTEQVAIPHEPGEWMRFRALSWRDLQAAQEARVTRALQDAANMSSELLSTLKSQLDAREIEAKQRYDEAAILQAGIADWSYDTAVTSESIDLLDQPTADWAFGEIVGRNVIASAEGED